MTTARPQMDRGRAPHHGGVPRARRGADDQPSLVSGPVAALCSLVVPGLGQILARQVRRGLVILGSVATMIPLLAWRVGLIASRQAGIVGKYSAALRRQPGFIGLMTTGIVLLWLWSVWDAHQQAERLRRGGAAVFVLILSLFFALGWQISEINLYKAITEFDDTWPLLSRVLWPWEAAVTRRTETLQATAALQVPCTDSPPGPSEERAGEPYLLADPTCGELSDLDEANQIIPGTVLSLKGRGFAPRTETQIWWDDPIGNEFQIRQEGEYVSVLTDDAGTFQVEVTMPYRLMPPSAEGAQPHEVQARQVTAVGALVPSDPLKLSIERMIETIFLGMMATAFGIVLAVPVSFLAARNLMSHSPITMVLYYITRTILNIVRSIEPLIWVIIATQWVGLGPFAGILALTVHTVAALGKLYSEAIEGIDPGPIEAVQATGATRLQTIMYAVVPQMIPPFVSFSIYRWDVNVRMSTVIGMVGGGGIGFILIQYIRLLNFRAAGIAVWFIAITVAILDSISSEIREKYT